MRKILRLIYLVCSLINRAFYRLIVMSIKKSMFAEIGENVSIGRGSIITYKNIYVGNNVAIGDNATFLTSVAKIKIGNNVMFGPHVFMITGDHRIDVIGRYMADIKESEKTTDNDRDIILEDDIWIGANVVILKGVTIREGSVIAAGSIVTKDVEPYCIYGGVPAKKIKERFTQEQVKEHKRLLTNQKG